MHHSLRWDTNGRDGLGLEDAGGTQSRPEGAHLFGKCGSGKGQDKIHTTYMLDWTPIKTVKKTPPSAVLLHCQHKNQGSKKLHYQHKNQGHKRPCPDRSLNALPLLLSKSQCATELLPTQLKTLTLHCKIPHSLDKKHYNE